MIDFCWNCLDYGMYCKCDERLQDNLDEMWEHNVDARSSKYEMDEFDEYYAEKMQNAQPTEDELKQAFRDEIEMLIELGFD